MGLQGDWSLSRSRATRRRAAAAAVLVITKRWPLRRWGCPSPSRRRRRRGRRRRRRLLGASARRSRATTRRRARRRLGRRLGAECLHARHADRVDDVGDGAAAAEVVDGLGEALGFKVGGKGVVCAGRAGV